MCGTSLCAACTSMDFLCSSWGSKVLRLCQVGLPLEAKGRPGKSSEMVCILYHFPLAFRHLQDSLAGNQALLTPSISSLAPGRHFLCFPLNAGRHTILRASRWRHDLRKAAGSHEWVISRSKLAGTHVMWRITHFPQCAFCLSRG